MSHALHRILVIDDDHDIQDVVAAVLEDLGGYTVEGCISGVAAIARAPVFEPDLILLDMAMPDMDGLMTLHHLRALRSTERIPVIFFTAKATDPAQLARLPGVVGFIAKPFHHRGLIEHIKSLWTAQGQLRQIGVDTERMSAIRHVYLLGLPQRHDVLQTLWAAQTYGALTQMQHHVHQLAGSGASLGFAELSATATALELELQQTLVTRDARSTLVSPAASARLAPLIQHLYQALQQSHTTSPHWPLAPDPQHRTKAE